MNWQFWKKTAPISNKYKAYKDIVSSDNELTYSLLAWETEELQRFTDTHVVLQKTITEPTNYSRLLSPTTQIHSSIKEDIKNRFEVKMKHIIIKNSIFENLYKTLDNLHEECTKEGFQKFSEIAKENAKKILKATYENFPDYEYYLYPTEDREIAIDCNPQKGKGILILCDSNGSVAYFSTLAGKNSRFRCDDIEDFPYELLWKAFKGFNEEKKYSLKIYTTKKTSNIINESTTGIKDQYVGNY